MANELKKYNITVTVFCPGPIKTDFHRRAGKGMSRTAISAEKAAELGFKAVMKGKGVVVPGVGIKAMMFAIRFIPRKFVVRLTGKLQEMQKSMRNEE